MAIEELVLFICLFAESALTNITLWLKIILPHRTVVPLRIIIALYHVLHVDVCAQISLPRVRVYLCVNPCVRTVSRRKCIVAGRKLILI